MRQFFIAFFLCIVSLAAQYQQVELAIDASGRKGTMHLYRFADRTHAIKLIERGAHDSLTQAMAANQCVAGCNGGFYDPEGRPLGRVIASGKSIGSVNTVSSLTSGVIYQAGKTLAIERSKSFFARKGQAEQLLQTGPFLVEHGQAVAGLSADKRARRTFIATDGKGEWFIAYAPPISLAQLGKALAESGKAYGFSIETALNFDGGSSSGLWVKRGEDSPLYLREINSVSNFFGLNEK